MKKMLENLMGITETKIFMVETFIRMAIRNGGSISRDDLVVIKELLIKESRDAEMGEVLDTTKVFKSQDIEKEVENGKLKIKKI